MSPTVPMGWASAPLDEIFQPRSERVHPKDFPTAPYIGLEQVEAHTNKILSTVLASTMSSGAARFLAGDTLYGRMRPYLNKVIQPSYDGLASAEFIVFPSIDHVDGKFLLWRLSSYDVVEFACSQYEGDRPRVKFDQLGKFVLNLPPRLEQTRIVEKLEELLSDLDAGVAELRAAQRKLLQYRQSLLKAAMDGALTVTWRQGQKALPAHSHPSETGAELVQRILIERRARWEAKQLARLQQQGKAPPKDWKNKYREPVSPAVDNLSPLPAGWEWASLDQLAEFITSGSRGWAEYYASTGAIFIRSQNINTDSLDLNDIAFVNPPPSSEGARTLVQSDDLLLTITGANVGKMALVETELSEAYVSQHVALIRPLEPALSRFLHLFLTSGVGGRKQLNEEAYGAGKPGLNLQQVAAVAIPVPGHSELVAMLESLTAQLEAHNDQSSAIENAIKQSAAQRKNLLKAAFAGQLVPQDPNDEPASMLLERIRAERAARALQPRERRTRDRKIAA